MRKARKASRQEQARTFAQLDDMCRMLDERLAHIRIAGPLTNTQDANLQFAVDVVEGLRALFRAQRVQQGLPAIPTKDV
jgi:hypothetical protein